MAIVQKQFLYQNPCYKSNRKIEVKGLMLHSVGVPQPSAQVFVNSWNKVSYDRACVHAFIDANNGNIIQTLPWNHRAWHCGSSGNNTHIGVEMCEPSGIVYTRGSSRWSVKDGAKVADVRSAIERTYNSAVELFTMLCREYNLNPLEPGVVVSHSEGHKLGIATNHGDPEHLWQSKVGIGYTMDGFREELARRLNSKPSDGQNGTQKSFRIKVRAEGVWIRTGPSLAHEQSKTQPFIVPGIYTIVETLDDFGKLKSGLGWVNLANKDVIRI